MHCWSSTWDRRILQLTEVCLVDAQTVHCPLHVEYLPHCRSCSLEKQANSSHKNEMVKQVERQTTSVKIFLIQTSQVQHFRWDDKKIGYPIDLTRSIPHLLLCKSAVLLMELFSAQMHCAACWREVPEEHQSLFWALALWPTVLVLNWVYCTSEKMPKNFLCTHTFNPLVNPYLSTPPEHAQDISTSSVTVNAKQIGSKLRFYILKTKNPILVLFVCSSIFPIWLCYGIVLFWICVDLRASLCSVLCPYCDGHYHKHPHKLQEAGIILHSLLIKWWCLKFLLL